MKMHEALPGGAIGVTTGAVLAQSMDLAAAIVVGLISGTCVAFAARGSRTFDSGE